MDPATQAAAAPEAEQALRLTAARLTTLVEGIPQLVWRSRDGGDWTWASPQWMAHTGQGEAECRGLGWLDAIQPDDRERTMAAWREAGVRGLLDVEHRIRRASDGTHRWFATRASIVRNPATGSMVEWLGTSTDVQAFKELQGRQQVLVAELQHRTRNLMAVVRSIMEATLRGSPDLDRFASAYRDRLGALARANSLLSRLGDGRRVAFDELLRLELSGSGALDAQGRGERVMLDGPAGVGLRSSTVQTFALALHELATNALKHGALAQPRGRLAVRWRLLRDGDGVGPRLRVDWTEGGVALPGPGPTQGDGALGRKDDNRGYGRSLIERALPYQLGAETSYEIGPDGVRCTITLPVAGTTG